MSGYLVNLFKYPPADVESIRKSDALQNQIATENNSLVRNVVWSNLDRIEIRRIEDFKSYRSADESEKSWIGERQFAMLYDLTDESSARLKYRVSEEHADHCRFRFEPAKDCEPQKRDTYRFFGISMVNFSPVMHEYVYGQNNPGEVIHREMTKVLQELCASESAKFLDPSLEYEIYGTLGSAECAIIWLVNQYTDVIALIEALRKIKCTKKEYFTSNVYTIMGLSNPLSNSDIFKGSKGIFNLRLIKRGAFDIDAFKKELSKYVESINDINIVLGKYDVSITFDSSAIKENIYADNRPIHFRSEKYYPIILEAHTELMQKPGEEQIEPIKYEYCKDIEEISTIANIGCFVEVRDAIEDVTKADIFAEMPYLKETLWLLYQDFVKNMASEFSYPWTIDLGYAFQKSIEYMQEILKKETGMGKNEIINFIENFIDSIRQTILHISQASKLYFEIPNSHLKQTGAYSKVLSAYYGVIKKLLKISYNLPRCNMQSEIIPFITFDVKPKVESEFFEPFKVQERRVVNFELPYEALTDLPKYSKLLAHEVFHYITPERRDVRNHLYGCIIWTEIIKSICYQRFLSLYNYNVLQNKEFSYETWCKSCGEIIRDIKADIWNGILDRYEYLMSSYIDDEWCLWSEYYHNIDEKALPQYREDESCILRIYNFIKVILEKNIISKEEKNDKCYTAIIKAIKQDFADSHGAFMCWYLSSDALTRLGTKATDIIDACREAFADFFMIQVMHMDVKEYLLTIFDFANVYEPYSEMQPMQKFRLGMVIDYIWGQEEELDVEKIGKYIEKMGLEEGQSKKLYTLWEEYERYAILYRKVFHHLFSAIDFNKIERTETEGLFAELDRFNNKVVAYVSPQKEAVFESNRFIIENMQKQDSLESIYSKNCSKNLSRRNLEPIRSIKGRIKVNKAEKCEELIREDIHKFFPAVQSLEGFMRTFESVVKELRDNTSEPLWFRGHRSAKYKLIPSLYRIKDGENYAYSASLRSVMEDLTDAFRVKAFHVPEISAKGNDSLLGTMVSMQHYRIETNLMDWSQQIFSALYFALEKYIDNPNEKAPEVNARVYILNPARFNIMMKEVLGSKAGDGHYAIPALLDDNDKYARYIPFLSPKDRGTDGQDEYNYPFAMYAPYVNPRIKAQAGCFTIFSINASDDKENGESSYMRFDLEVLQNKCRKKGKTSYKMFLGYIDIDREYVVSIAKNIRAMGITKRYIYPELSVIAEEMKEEIKSNYLDEKK